MNRPVWVIWLGVAACSATSFSIAGQPAAGPLHVGWATVDITPSARVVLDGSGYKRVTSEVEDPVTATVLALETRDGDRVLEQAIMISFDLVRMTKEVHEGMQRVAAGKLKDFDSSKLFCGATHSHCSPSISYERTGPGQLYDISKETDVMTPQEYILLLYERVGAGIVEAWQRRKPAGMSWGLGNAAIGYNRRLTYTDGSAIMGFDTARPDFSHVEGSEDHAVEMLFFWDADQKLTGTLLNIACPSQVGRKAISADFWHPIREGIKAKYGPGIHVFAQCAAAGDQCPDPIVRSKAEKVMTQRRNLSWKQELANRVLRAVDDVWPWARADVQTHLVFVHRTIKLDLPNKNSYNEARWMPSTVPVEFHVLRLGDIAMATNPFELFLDYGIQIKGRSKAVLTFISQLTCDHQGYLPTRRAVTGGDYSAVNHTVGPIGGRVLVDESVTAINALWP
ncbi:MAG: hypothetical protein HUU20_09175 [Pirellulales bacterium]|nr:hypothetical protein [Pirellulales bacterium]